MSLPLLNLERRGSVGVALTAHPAHNLCVCGSHASQPQPEYTMEWTDVMLDEDKVEEIDGEIVDAIIEDDKEKLISLIHTPGLRPSNSLYNTAYYLLDKICSFDAVNCATSLLDGELSPVIRQLDVKKPVIGNGAAFPLHFAAKYVVPGVTQLFLSRGASVDTKLSCRLGMQHRSGLLPLEIALDVVSGYLPRDSGATFQLIAPLCHPMLKRPLKAIKLLASYSKNVEKKAYYYAMEGKLTEFIVLLAVAHEKVLVPITFSKQDGDCWNGSMTLDQWLAYEFGSLHNEENKVLGSFAKMNVTGIERKERPLESIARLLEVFGTAGNAIGEYILFGEHIEGKERYDKVEKDVTLMLEKAGCRLKDGDFDSNIGNWMNSGDSTRSLPFLHPHLSLQSTCNFPSRQKGRILGNHVPESNFVSHYSTSLDVQVKNQTKTMEQGLLKYLSRKKLAYISMLIKKGIRSA